MLGMVHSVRSTWKQTSTVHTRLPHFKIVGPSMVSASLNLVRSLVRLANPDTRVYTRSYMVDGPEQGTMDYGAQFVFGSITFIQW